MTVKLILSGFLLLILLMNVVHGGRGGAGRFVKIVNRSQSRVEVHWLNSSSSAETLLSNPFVHPGADFPMNSFVGHEFVIKELPDAEGKCLESECKTHALVISENDEQLVEIDFSLSLRFVDNRIKAQQISHRMMKTCRSRAERMIKDAEGDSTSTLQGMQELVKCVEGGVAERLQEVNEEIAYQAQIRTDIAALLEEYTCIDNSLETSPDIATEGWIQNGVATNVSRTVHIKHDRPASRIHVIDNFINPEECEAITDAASKSLHKATVADGKGGSKLSENRKAMQAGVKVPWNQENNDHPIARLSRRVYDYVNHVLDMNIQEHGQEDLMSIQYFGRGSEDPEPDRYTPHCDGDCSGNPHKNGTRMATMVMYCDVPEKGGHTNFRNSGVHVKPARGAAIFFSYIDPETRIMDKGFTEHSGCPVFEGTKRIAAQWVRLGVDSGNPWDSFNTLGIKRSDFLAAGGTTEDFVDDSDQQGDDEPEVLNTDDVHYNDIDSRDEL